MEEAKNYATIQDKLEARKNNVSLDKLCVAANSFCNIAVADGRFLVAAKHVMSPLEVTSLTKVDSDIPKAVYCIAVGEDKNQALLGKEIIIDATYGSRGMDLTAKVKNNALRLVDVLGGSDNLKFVEKQPVCEDKTKMILNADGKCEFWTIHLFTFNQYAGCII